MAVPPVPTGYRRRMNQTEKQLSVCMFTIILVLILVIPGYATECDDWLPVGFADVGVTCLTSDNNGILYAGAGNNGVCAWNGTVWSQLDGFPCISGMDKLTVPVCSLASVNDILYAGTSGSGVWAWDGKSWSRVGGSSGLADDRIVVSSLASINGTLYAGTSLIQSVMTIETAEKNGYVSGVWAWNGKAWTRVGASSDLFGNAAGINCLTSINGVLYAGTRGSGVWAWDGMSWSQMDGPSSILGEDEICSITVNNQILYAGTSASGVWKWDGKSWSKVGDLAGVSSLTSINGRLYAAGVPSGVWVRDENVWSEIGLKSDTSGILCLATANKTLYAGTEAYGGYGVWRFKTQSFKDINGYWAEKNIEELVTMGAVTGYSDATFKPDNPITRAEFATMLVKAFRLEPKQGKMFTDTMNHWARDTISTAAAYGIVGGYDDKTFGPDDLITREQMAVMIVKTTKLELASGELSFTDSKKISAWAKDSIITALNGKIMKGYSDGSFKPNDNATRAEAVTVIVNAMN